MQDKTRELILNVKTYNLLCGTAQEVSGWEELESLLWEVQLLYGALKKDKFFTKDELKEKMKELKNGYGKAYLCYIMMKQSHSERTAFL